MSINERIKRILKEKGWQDQELATRIGMSKAVLSQRFSKNNWSVDELITVSDMTGYSFSWICEGMGPELESQHLEAIERYAVAEPHLNYDAKPDIVRALSDQVKTQSEYIDLLKDKVSSLEQELAKYKKGKSGSTTP